VPAPSCDDAAFLYEVAIRANHRTVRARAHAPSASKSAAKEEAAARVLADSFAADLDALGACARARTVQWLAWILVKKRRVIARRRGHRDSVVCATTATEWGQPVPDELTPKLVERLLDQLDELPDESRVVYRGKRLDRCELAPDELTPKLVERLLDQLLEFVVKDADGLSTKRPADGVVDASSSAWIDALGGLLGAQWPALMLRFARARSARCAPSSRSTESSSSTRPVCSASAARQWAVRHSRWRSRGNGGSVGGRSGHRGSSWPRLRRSSKTASRTWSCARSRRTSSSSRRRSRT